MHAENSKLFFLCKNTIEIAHKSADIYKLANNR